MRKSNTSIYLSQIEINIGAKTEPCGTPYIINLSVVVVTAWNPSEKFKYQDL
jgi:hypothetical protein